MKLIQQYPTCNAVIDGTASAPVRVDSARRSADKPPSIGSPCGFVFAVSCNLAMTLVGDDDAPPRQRGAFEVCGGDGMVLRRCCSLTTAAYMLFGLLLLRRRSVSLVAVLGLLLLCYEGLSVDLQMIVLFDTPRHFLTNNLVRGECCPPHTSGCMYGYCCCLLLFFALVNVKIFTLWQASKV